MNRRALTVLSAAVILVAGVGVLILSDPSTDGPAGPRSAGAGSIENGRDLATVESDGMSVAPVTVDVDSVRRAATGTSERAFVVDERGGPIAGATVTFVPWRVDHWAHGIEPTLPPTGALAADGQVGLTAADGALDFEPDAQRLAVGDYGAVVWAARAGFRAACLEVEAGFEHELAGLQLVLEPAPTGTVSVVDSRGAPVAGARVEARAAAPPVRGGAVVGRNAHARSVFFLLATTDPSGRVVLPAGPGPLPGQAGGLEVRAGSGGQVSTWRRLPEGGAVELALEPSFQVGGRVLGFEAIHTPGAVTDGVVIERNLGRGWERCASGIVDRAGGYGPITAPAAVGARYRARIDSLACEPRPRAIEGVAPGASITLDLDAGLGWSLEIEPRSAATAERLTDASVFVSWEESGGRVRQVARIDRAAATEAEPPFTARGLPEDVELTVHVDAAGFAPLDVGGLWLPADVGQVVGVELRPAAALRGTIAGAPSGGVDLLVRSIEGGWLTRVAVQLDSSGGFATERVPEGPLEVAAVAVDGSSTPVARCDGADDRSVELAFGPPRGLDGTVIDLESRLPVAAATVTPVVELAAAAFATRTERIAVDGAGRFRLDHRAPPGEESLRLSVRAPGYREASVAAPLGPGSGPLEIGLERQVAGTLNFESEHGIDLTRCSIEADGPTPIPLQWVPADGELALEELALGNYEARFHEVDDDRLRRLWFNIGRRGDAVAIALDGVGRLEVLLAAADQRGGTLYVTGTTGRVSQRFEYDVDGPSLAVDRIPLGTWTAQLYGADGRQVASGEATLTEAESRATIELTPAPVSLVVRVVDAEGGPVANGQVAGYSRRTLESSLWATTDDDGRVVHRGPVGDDFVVDAHAPGRGAAIAVPATRAVDGELEVVLERGAAAVVRFVDGSGPIVGAEVSFVNLSRAIELTTGVLTDADGRARLAGLAPGTVEAQIRDPRWLPAVVRVEAAATPVETEQRLFLRGGARVTVVDGEGRAVSGARVRVLKPEIGDYLLDDYAAFYGIRSEPDGFTTGADGGLWLEGLPEGPVELRVERLDLTATAAALIRPGEIVSITVELAE